MDSFDDEFAESDDENQIRWSDGKGAAALMNADLEVSPLVQRVPALLESKPPPESDPAPGLPKSFSNELELGAALKKRKIETSTGQMIALTEVVAEHYPLAEDPLQSKERMADIDFPNEKSQLAPATGMIGADIGAEPYMELFAATAQTDFSTKLANDMLTPLQSETFLELQSRSLDLDSQQSNSIETVIATSELSQIGNPEGRLVNTATTTTTRDKIVFRHAMTGAKVGLDFSAEISTAPLTATPAVATMAGVDTRVDDNESDEAENETPVPKSLYSRVKMEDPEESDQKLVTIIDGKVARNKMKGNDHDDDGSEKFTNPTVSVPLRAMRVPVAKDSESVPQHHSQNSIYDNKAEQPEQPSICQVAISSNNKGSKEYNEADGSFTRKSAKRKASPIRNAKKVLTAKKEKDHASMLLRGRDDLLECIPEADCRFLANEFWIFTVQQLKFILQSPGRRSDEEAEQERINKAQNLRVDIAKKLQNIWSLKHDGSGKDNISGVDEEMRDVDAEASKMLSPDEAERKLCSWLECIENFSLPTTKKPHSKSEFTFPLDGPISCLFPASTLNFLLSVPIRHLKGFVSLKKTETGAICDMFKVWRRTCALSDLNALALAKHLLGVSSRVDFALTTLPAVSANDRRWMGDPIIQMTGAAKSFLVDYLGLYTAEDFVKSRTKDLSLKLAAWREDKGLVPLKGSGKVAMISGWKAAAKEGIEAEADAGRIVTKDEVNLETFVGTDFADLEDLTTGSQTYNSSGREQTDVSALPTKRQKVGQLKENIKRESDDDENSEESAPLESLQSIAKNNRQMKYALHTSLFLEDVLGEDITKLLSSLGFNTASSLLDATMTEKANLYTELTAAKQGKDNIACEMLVKDWCQKLSDELDLLRPKSSPLSSHKAKEKVKEKPKALTETIVSKKLSAAPLPRFQSNRSHHDPYDALSAVTKRFLASMDISNVEKFLSTRTTDIATEFVKWRISEGMPELKGLGAIASVSGWKAACRKVAREMGQNEVAVLEPSDKLSWGPHSRELSKVTKEFTLEEAPDMLRIDNEELEAHQDVLLGKARHVLSFIDCQKSNVFYRFELSVRKPGPDDKCTIFITYKNAMSNFNDMTDPTTKETRPSVVICLGSSQSRIPVLKNSQTCSNIQGTSDIDSYQPFAYNKLGMGLLDISSFGVQQISNQSIEGLKEAIQEFVLSGNEKMAVVAKAELDGNIIITRQNHDQYGFLFVASKAIERGQTTSICFPSLKAYMKSGRYEFAEFERRHLFQDAFQLLSAENLLQLRAFFENDLFDRNEYENLFDGHCLPADVENACKIRRRLHWVSLKLAKAIDVDEAQNHKLYFGYLTNQDLVQKKVSPFLHQIFKQALTEEVRKELFTSIELDGVCNSKARGFWCPMFTTTFHSLVDAIVHYYTSCEGASAAGMLDTVKSCLKNALTFSIDLEHYDDLVMSRNANISSEEISCDNLYKGLLGCHGKFEITDSSWKNRPLTYIVCKGQQEDDEFSSGDEQNLKRKTQLLLNQPEVVRRNEAVINFTWYRHCQWRIATTVVDASASLLSKAEQPIFLHMGTHHELEKLAKETMGIKINKLAPMEAEIEDLHYHLSEDGYNNAKPTSFHFFIGLVWPVLRKLGWRLDPGETPRDMTFIAPDSKTSFNKRSSQWKVRRAHARQELLRQVNSIGLGSISKTAKRLIVAVVPTFDGEERINSRPPLKNTSTQNAMDLFQDYVRDTLDYQDNNGLFIVKNIVGKLLECLSDVSPLLADLTPVEDDDKMVKAFIQEDNLSPKSDVSELLGFLTILPDILRQCDLPLQEINDTLEIVQELFLFLSSWHDKLFDKAVQPPTEVYIENGKKVISPLTARLRHLHNITKENKSNTTKDESGERMGVMTEIVSSQDKANLTDFLVTVLEQAVPCRASEHDVKKKFRRIHVGYPGFVCRHCLGSANEGRYFFTTIESLTTASTVFEKHVLKCPFIPPEIRTKVMESRVYHSEQRRQLPLGAQQAFFNRLWDQLRSAKIEGGDSGEIDVESCAEKKEAAKADTTVDLDSRLIFKEHLSLLDYLRNSPSWRNNKEVRTVLSQYYNCIEFGGRVYYTPSMPKHFSSEWLLNKIAPRRFSRKKMKHLPG